MTLPTAEHATLTGMGMTDDDRSTSPDPMGDALYRSLLESVVDYVGKENVRQVVVHADPHDGSAQVEICLEDESFERFEYAVERMGEVRSMFMHELSVEYVLLIGDACRSHESADTRELVYA